MTLRHVFALFEVLMDSLKLNSTVPISGSELGTGGFNDRLLKLAKKYDSQASFAVACGVSVSGIQRLLAGGMPRLPILVSIARGNNVNLEWLATGKGAVTKESSDQKNFDSLPCIYDNAGNIVDLSEFTFIPHYDVSANTGNGCNICQEKFVFSMCYGTFWIENYLKANPKDLIALTAKGDSMAGVIDDRDVMIIDTANKSLSDGIYVIRIDGNLLVKRAQLLPNHIIRISSANPAYEPFEVDMKRLPDNFEIVGSIVHTERGALFRYSKN